LYWLLLSFAEKVQYKRLEKEGRGEWRGGGSTKQTPRSSTVRETSRLASLGRPRTFANQTTRSRCTKASSAGRRLGKSDRSSQSTGRFAMGKKCTSVSLSTNQNIRSPRLHECNQDCIFFSFLKCSSSRNRAALFQKVVKPTPSFATWVETHRVLWNRDFRKVEV
jgi:hypothetical protein